MFPLSPIPTWQESPGREGYSPRVEMGRDIFKWGREIFPVEGNVSRGWKGDFAGERKGGSIFQGEGGTFFQGKGGG